MAKAKKEKLYKVSLNAQTHYEIMLKWSDLISKASKPILFYKKSQLNLALCVDEYGRFRALFWDCVYKEHPELNGKPLKYAPLERGVRVIN